VDYDMSFQDTGAAVAKSTGDGNRRGQGGRHDGLEFRFRGFVTESMCRGNLVMWSCRPDAVPRQAGFRSCRGMLWKE
jgi:hypothetical protein